MLNQAGKCYECLQYFAFQFGELYGRNHLIYNVHSLIHLVDDVEAHGPFDTISAFPFETFLGTIKSLIRSPNKVLAQVVRRISELENISEYAQVVKNSIFNQHSSSNIEYASLKQNTRSDYFYLCKNEVIIKIKAVSVPQVSFKTFSKGKNYFSTPIKSKNIDMFRSHGMAENVTTMPIGNVHLVAKCWVIPAGMDCCIVPLLHHNY